MEIIKKYKLTEEEIKIVHDLWSYSQNDNGSKSFMDKKLYDIYSILKWEFLERRKYKEGIGEHTDYAEDWESIEILYDEKLEKFRAVSEAMTQLKKSLHNKGWSD